MRVCSATKKPLLSRKFSTICHPLTSDIEANRNSRPDAARLIPVLTPRFHFSDLYVKDIDTTTINPTGRLLYLPTEVRFMIWSAYLRDMLSGIRVITNKRQRLSRHNISPRYIQALHISTTCKTAYKDIIEGCMHLEFVNFIFMNDTIGSGKFRKGNLNSLSLLSPRISDAIKGMAFHLSIFSSRANDDENLPYSSEIRAVSLENLHALAKLKNLECLHLSLDNGTSEDEEGLAEPVIVEDTFQLNDTVLQEIRTSKGLALITGLKEFHLSVEVWTQGVEYDEDELMSEFNFVDTLWAKSCRDSRYLYPDSSWELILTNGMIFDDKYNALKEDLEKIMKQPRKKVVDNSHL